MQSFAVVLTVVLAGAPALSRGPAAPARTSVTLPACLVSLIEEAEVPAQEAGKLESINVREGQQVAVGELLAQIDDGVAKIALTVADLQLTVAKEKAENDINLRYSKAAAEVAKAEYKSALEVNERRPGTVPQMELNRLKLVWDKSDLQIEQAQEDQKVLGLEANVREAELDAAKAQVARRQIFSPLGGVVEKVHLHAGEWVKPGDPTFHVVRMDRLRIESFLNAAQFAPWQVDGRQVSVEVVLVGGRREQFAGKIVFVSGSDQAGGQYRVWAEVQNRQQAEHWLLRPGQLAEMTILLDSR